MIHRNPLEFPLFEIDINWDEGIIVIKLSKVVLFNLGKGLTVDSRQIRSK